MYCKNCGNELNNDDLFCGKCGEPTNLKHFDENSQVITKVNNSGNSNVEKISFGIVGFVAPIAGIIIYVLTKNDRPEQAKIALIAAIVKIPLSVIYVILQILFEIII